MIFVQEWRRVLRKAWSVRLAILAGVLSGAEIIVPLFVDAMPRSVFAALAFLTTCAAVFARLLAQPRMHEDG